MLPPPALTVSISTEGRASGTPATAPPPAPPSATGAPCVTRLASALVPPMSSVRSSESPTVAPTSRAPTTPPAGPDNASEAARPAADGGGSVPPLDVMTHSAGMRRARTSRSRREHAHGVDYPVDLPVGQRLEHARRSHPLRDPHDVAARHQRRSVIAPEVVQGGPVLAPQPQQVLEAAGRHEHDTRPRALEQSVGCDRGAVHQEIDREPGTPIQLVQRPEHAGRRILGRRHHLAHGDRAVLAEGDEIGEGPADIHPHPHCPPPQLPIVDCGLRIPGGRVARESIRNPQSAIGNLTAGAPTATCRPRACRRTRPWQSPPASPPNPPTARTEGSRRWCAADRPRSHA